MTAPSNIGIMSLFPAFSLVAGCYQILGLGKEYPPPGDGSEDTGQEDPALPDIDTESRCIIGEPRQLTNFPEGSKEVAVDFLQPPSGDPFFGVAWTYSNSAKGDIMFASISLEGDMLEGPVELSQSGDSSIPDIAAAGDGFGIVWQESIEVEAVPDFEVQFAYVSYAGEILTSDVHIQSPDPGYAMKPTLSWNESADEFGCAWQDSRSGTNEIWFVTIDRLGNMTTGARTSEIGGTSITPDIAWSGSEYGVTWINSSTGNDSVYFKRLNSSGSPASSDILVHLSTGAARSPVISRDFSGYALGWSDNSSGKRDIFFTRLEWLGSKLIETRRITSTEGEAEASIPHLLFESSPINGNIYHLCWEENRDNPSYRDIYVLSIDSSGLKITYEGKVTDTRTASSACRIALSPSPDGNALFWVRKTEAVKTDLFFSIFSCDN